MQAWLRLAAYRHMNYTVLPLAIKASAVEDLNLSACKSLQAAMQRQDHFNFGPLGRREKYAGQCLGAPCPSLDR